MSQFSLRTRLMLWYALMLLLLLNAVYGAVYITVDIVMTKQTREKAIATADRLAEKVTELGSLDIEMDDDGLLRDGLLYALYTTDGTWVDGWDSNFLSEFEQDLGKVRQIHHGEHSHWVLYDRAVYIDSIYAGVVRVMLPSAEQAILNRMLIIWIVSLIPGVLLSLLGGRIIAVSALKPLRSVIKTAKQIGTGDLATRIPPTGHTDEIGELAETFNDMADNLQSSFEREKRFTSDASHEMRTPVAVIIAHAEDAKNDDTLESYRKTNEIILSKGKELQKMLSQLLTLARAVEQAETMEWESLDLYSVLKNITKEAEEWAARKNIAIYTDLESGITVKADLMMFTRMAVNLLNNAVQYGREGGLIQVTSRKDQKKAVAVITFRDDGAGISEEDLPHIFDRFYRVDKARNGTQDKLSAKSAGLGLSFVDMIVKLHKGKISVESTKGAGTCFTVEIPLSTG